MSQRCRFWGGVALIWLLATMADRLWWALQGGVPAWDQADYFNRALDHGFALVLLPGGIWQGWMRCCICLQYRPLAPLVIGSEMALSGGAQTGGVFSGPVWRFPASLNSVPAAVMSVEAGVGSCDQE